MNVYMVNEGKKYALYDGKKTIENIVEGYIVEAEKSWPKRKMRELGDWVKGKVSKLYDDNLDSLVKAASAEDPTVYYSSAISEEKAKGEYRKIAKKTMNRNYLIMGISTLLIPLGYVPPFIFVPMTSFMAAGIIVSCWNLRKAIKKGMLKAKFKPDGDVSRLEEAISAQYDCHGRGINNEELLKCYLDRQSINTV